MVWCRKSLTESPPSSTFIDHRPCEGDASKETALSLPVSRSRGVSRTDGQAVLHRGENSTTLVPLVRTHHPLFLRWKPEEVGGWGRGGSFLVVGPPSFCTSKLVTAKDFRSLLLQRGISGVKVEVGGGADAARSFQCRVLPAAAAAAPAPH